MNHSQVLLTLVIAGTIALLFWGRWRHDIVALAALLACVVFRLVPADEAFTGFGHPAVITVACVLVLSEGLKNTGVIDALAQRVVPRSDGPLRPIAAFATTGAFSQSS